MKKIIALFLACSILLCSCGTQTESSTPTNAEPASVETKAESISSEESEIATETVETEVSNAIDAVTMATSKEYSGLNDPELLCDVEDSIYENLITTLNSEEYCVENVSASYVSQEFIDESAYNSKSNIYFGYTMEELNDQFQGKRFVFSLGEDGQTTVKEYEAYDDTYDQIVRNVAIGSGVILVCITVSVVTGGAGMPAVSMVFAMSAKTGAIMAVESATIGAVAGGVVTGVQTGDMDEALKSAALAGSEGFKWGAITGAVVGGISETSFLYGGTKNGLSMNQVAIIQKDNPKLSLDVIKRLHSMDEYNVYKDAVLKDVRVGGKHALVQEIDWDTPIEDMYGKTMTNAERVAANNSPVDPSGIPYELHHVGQQPDSPLAILTKKQHMQDGHNTILHFRGENTDVVHDNEWHKVVREFWASYYKYVKG